MKTNHISAMRIGVLMIGAATIFAALIMKLYFLQMVGAQEIIASSNKARNFHKILPPTRGLILDRNNHSLAQNKNTYTVIAGKKFTPSVTETIFRAGSLLDLSNSDIHQHITAIQKPKTFWRDIEKSISEETKEILEKANIPGIFFSVNPTRFYPEGSLAAHVIGFTGAENKGLAGLELTLNDMMEGTPHPISTDKDIRQRMMAEDDYTKIMTRGVDYVLTLDSYIQYVVERELKKVCEETEALQANAVVMHPGSGDILALANYPTFDPNHYADYSAEIRKNRLLTDIFEPGSILKPFVLCAALEQQVVTPETVFYCENGSYYFKGHTIRDDIHRFGDLSVHDILVRSSNIGMVKITQRLGKDPNDYRGQLEILYRYLNLFGFKNVGEKTTNDLPGETGGLISPPKQWWPAHIGAIPFGQAISTNTLVLTAAYSALANRGVYCKPRIILGKRRPDGVFQPAMPDKPLPILSNSVADQVVQMMIDVTEDPEGTGYGRVGIPGFHIAGKTGTAQKADPKNGGYIPRARVASFAGFFPAENPQAVIVIVVDQPQKKKYGGEIAGPVFEKIAEELVAYWGMSPTDRGDPKFIAAMNAKKGTSKKGQQPVPQFTFGVNRQMPISLFPNSTVTGGVMPDLMGLPIREAYARLALNGLHAQFEGSGKVKAQPLPAGSPLEGKTNIGVVSCEPALTDPEIQISTSWVVQR